MTLQSQQDLSWFWEFETVCKINPEIHEKFNLLYQYQQDLIYVVLVYDSRMLSFKTLWRKSMILLKMLFWVKLPGNILPKAPFYIFIDVVSDFKIISSSI